MVLETEAHALHVSAAGAIVVQINVHGAGLWDTHIRCDVLSSAFDRTNSFCM
jgi:hypothetical protein